MKTSCRYHPTKPAHWNCPECGVNYCPDCVTVRDKDGYNRGEKIYLCPKCNAEVQWRGAANIIDPFWNRLPKFFTYPFSPQPLILITVLSFAALLIAGTGIINSLMGVLIWGISLKYSYAALKLTAQGNLEPPPINAQTISDDFLQVFKQLIVYAVGWFIFIGLVFKGGFFAGGLFLVFALLAAPAVIILLVTTNSLLHALNPMMFIRLAIRIGWGYLLMLFFLMLLGGAPAVLGQFVISHLPASLHPLLFAFAKNFYTLISYHMMGYVILQYHEAIGYQVEYENFRDPASQGGSGSDGAEGPILNEVNIMIQEGKLDEAIAFIQKATGENGFKNLALSERYLNLLKLKKRKKEFLAHATTHLDLLTRNNNRAEACRLYLQCAAIEPSFAPDPSSLFKIGGWLNESGKIKESVSAFNKLVKAYPNDRLVPKAYFRAAQVVHDRLMNPERAKRILTGLLQKYPDHEITPQIKTYLEHIF